MADSPESTPRPLAFEEADYQRNVQRVPRTLPDGATPHPGQTSAIFVVHGIGTQHWTETAAHLRAGFEDAFEEIASWHRKHPDRKSGVPGLKLPPPFVFEGYWADYDDLEVNFPSDWKRFNDRERSLFGNLWRERVVSGGRTLFWVLRRQVVSRPLKSTWRSSNRMEAATYTYTQPRRPKSSPCSCTTWPTSSSSRFRQAYANR